MTGTSDHTHHDPRQAAPAHLFQHVRIVRARLIFSSRALRVPPAAAVLTRGLTVGQRDAPPRRRGTRAAEQRFPAGRQLASGEADSAAPTAPACNTSAHLVRTLSRHDPTRSNGKAECERDNAQRWRMRARAASRPLRKLFELTHKEAQLALCLANGRSLQESAGEPGITPNTARADLRSTFSKTGSTGRRAWYGPSCEVPPSWAPEFAALSSRARASHDPSGRRPRRTD
jgi:DNA-binding CsgD family transcriptional regulator